MSKFYLENEYGQRIDLQNSDQYCIVTDTGGLGINYESNYILVGDMFFQNSSRIKQADFKMNLNFTQPGAFKKLQKLSNFMISMKELYLIYVPDLVEQTEYKREVDLVSFEKSDKADGLLTYQATFNSKSLFYTTNQNRFLIERAEGEMRFDFRWDARFNDYASRSVTVNNDGHVNAPFTIEFNGYAERPTMEVYRENTLINRLKFNLTVDEHEKILYSSVDGDLYVYHVDSSGIRTSILNLFNLEDENFFKLPTGTTFVKFTSDTGVMSKIYFNIFQYFKVV